MGDYKVTVNPKLEIDHYPLPTPEDLFVPLAGEVIPKARPLTHLKNRWCWIRSSGNT